MAQKSLPRFRKKSPKKARPRLWPRPKSCVKCRSLREYWN